MRLNDSKKFLLSLMAVAALTLSAGNASAEKPERFTLVNHPLLTEAPLSTDFIMGNPEAPVTLVEYASFSCPHCARFHDKILPVIKERYIDTGKAKYILRPFPLNEPALKAALLADCVGENSGDARYYTFADVLFKSQNKWAFEESYENSLRTIAQVGGVTPQQFDACVNDSERELKIVKMKKVGTDVLHVTHTPYVFLNARRFTEDMTAAELSRHIDSLLPNNQKRLKPATKAQDKEE